MTFRYRHGDRPLSGYTIKRGVGHGGFGEVYYAVSDGGREVALKSILQNHEVELRGVQHCINLKSPHLVSIFDVRTGEDGTPFVIMEYVAGPSLRDILREHPDGLGEEKSAYLLREAAKGLAYLHARGIVHRDLKPENVFYEDGYVKIGDYGLSKYISVSRQSGQTMSVGTVHYMAPEIGSGIYNRGIDIYALGIIFYEFLTGRVPFTGDSFGEILMKHLTAEPDLSRIDEPFRSVTARALAKKPEDRFPTVDEMAKELFRSSDLDARVSLFNPATLSVAAQRATADEASPATPTAPAGSPFATPDQAAPPPLPADGGAEAGAPPPDAPRPAPVPPEPPPDAPRRASGWRASQKITHAEAVAYDPLDQTQRLARVLFISLVAAVVLGVFGAASFGGIAGLLITMCAGAGSVLATELFLAGRFQISPGLPRRVVAAFLAFVPMVVGAAAYNPERGADSLRAALALLVGMLVVDWKERISPSRDERISVGQTIFAGVLGVLAGLIIAGGENLLLVGGGLAGVSLLVNAFSPYVPRERRRSLELQKERAQAEAFERAHSRRPARLRNHLKSAVRGAEARFKHAASNLGNIVQGVAQRESPAVPGASQAEIPRTAARIFWGFIAAALIAGGLSCFAAIVFEQVRGDDAAACLGFGMGMIGYAPFALYRGLWARRRSVWGRTVRPFLLFTALNGVLVSATFLVAAPHLWRGWGEEEIVACAVILACSSVLGGFLLAFERLVRGQEVDAAVAMRLPRAQRPVPSLRRFVQLFLGACAVATAMALVLVALLADFAGSHSDEMLAMLCGAIGATCGGAFFIRQGLRRVRGGLWQGSLRNFLLLAAVAGVAISALALSWNDDALHDDERFGVMIAGIFAAVFGIFAYLLKGPRTAEPHEAGGGIPGPQAPGAAAVAGRRTNPGLAALGMIFWILGVPAILWGAAETTGLAHAVELTRAPPVRAELLLPAVGIFLCALGSLSAVASRFRAGPAHLLRAVVGQAAVLLAVLAFLRASLQVTVSPELLVDFQHGADDFFGITAGAFLVTLFGVSLIAWPLRRKPGAGARAPEGSVPLPTKPIEPGYPKCL